MEEDKKSKFLFVFFWNPLLWYKLHTFLKTDQNLVRRSDICVRGSLSLKDAATPGLVLGKNSNRVGRKRVRNFFLSNQEGPWEKYIPSQSLVTTKQYMIFQILELIPTRENTTLSVSTRHILSLCWKTTTNLC